MATLHNFNTPADRDATQKFEITEFPLITTIDCENTIGSTRFEIEARNDPESLFSKETHHDIHLYSVLVLNKMNKEFEIKDTGILEDPDYLEKYLLIGVCVIPSGLLPDGRARFVCFDELFPSKGEYSAIDNQNNSKMSQYINSNSIVPPRICIDTTNDANCKVYIANQNYSYLCPLDHLTDTTKNDNIYNVIPIVNQNHSSSIKYNVERLSQYNSCLPSDILNSGKNSSYFDCGVGNLAYYYHVTGDMANYCPSPYNLDGTLNNQFFTQFHYNSSQNKYVSFLNPMEVFDGHKNTFNLIQSNLYSRNVFSENLNSSAVAKMIFDFRVDGDGGYYGMPCWESVINHFGVVVNELLVNSSDHREFYIPSISELAFMQVRLKRVNEIMQMFGKEPIDVEEIYVSSTESGYDSVYALQPYTGSIMSIYKSIPCKCRPFIMVA